jgi:non-heme chloroperoxidase
MQIGHPVSPTRVIGAVALAALAVSGGRARAQAAWHDPSPHRVRMITVAPNVALEVLDWGGTGDPIIFLHGFGNTAHSFDDFAPHLTDHFHVYGVTRRGNGISSRPETGNDVATLVTDVKAVMDTLGIARANLVGHSFGGQMLTKFALLFPDRVRTLVYLDAAFDAKNMIEPVPAPPRPPVTAEEQASSAGMQAYLRRIEGITLPEAEVRTMFAFGPDGKVLSTKHTRSPGWTQTNESQEHPAWDRIQAPALAVFNLVARPEHLYPWYSTMDSASRDMAGRYAAYWYGWEKQQEENFRREVPHGQVLELIDSHHFVFTANEPEVEHAMREFYAHN